MRVERIVKEDIRDIENIRDLSLIQILVDSLPVKVGSLFSTKSVCEDISISHKTASAWLDILEAFYYIFRVYPYRKTKIKSLKKMPKLYLCDWSEVEELPARFENLVAAHLLKYADYLYDVLGYKAKVYFLRDLEGREVDFLITVEEKPWFTVEVKESGKKVSKNLKYFAKREDIPFHYQVVYEENVDYEENGIRVISAEKFLTAFI
jgi:predicted AAA+ superfamily ATPase